MKMLTYNDNNNNDNRIELIGLNEFIQDDEDDIELGDADFERPFPDSDEAIRALQDIAESVYELEAECYRLRAELKTSNAERDEARKQICESHSRNSHQAYQHAIECNWDCYKETP